LGLILIDYIIFVTYCAKITYYIEDIR